MIEIFLKPIDYAKEHPLVFRLLFYILLFSSVVTLLATALQLYLDYQKDVALIERELKQIEESYMQSVALSVWKVDRDQTQTLLDGIAKLPGIEYLEIKSEDELIAKSGTPPTRLIITRAFPLVAVLKKEEIRGFGTLNVIASKEEAFQRLTQRVVIILSSQAFKTFLVSLFILLVLHSLVMRHLATMANFTKQLDLANLEDDLVLNRDHRQSKTRTDELDRVVTAINEMRSRLLQDILIQKQSEEALRASEQKFRAIFNQTFQFIGLLSCEGLLLEVNETALHFAGITESSVLNKPFWETPWWAHSTEVKKRIENAVLTAAAGEFIRFETSSQRSDGTLLDVDFSLKPIKDESGEVILLIPEGRDISERKETERELQHLRNLLKNIINSMPSILVGVDRDNQVIQWNVEAEKATGIKAIDAHKQVLTKVFPQLAKETERITQAINDRMIQKNQKVAMVFNNETTFSDITIYPLISNGVEGAVIRIDDITTRVRIEEMMVQSEKMASLGGLAAGMAHEINNPLAGMMQNAQVLRKRLSEHNMKNLQLAEECGTSMEAIQAFMEKQGVTQIFNSIQESGLRANHIVKNMLSFSHKSDAKYKEHDLGELMDKAIELAESDYNLARQYDFKKIKIIKKYEKNMPKTQCEENKVLQVFLNILINGAYAMGEGLDEKRSPCFTLSIKSDGQMAYVEIADNGPGMEEAVRKRIFEPFYTTKDIGRGTGLGLSVSYYIISDYHDGSISVESELGKGSKFIIRLPFRRPSLI
ncbi:PAS domain S-box protein [bacterium]|nr:PAS domain S-box protein [bacterium]